MDKIEGRYGARTNEGSTIIFSKKIETNYHSSSTCVLFVAPLFLTFKEQL